MAEKQDSTEKQRFKLRKDQVQPEALQLIPEALARKYNVVPLEVNRNGLKVIMADANDVLAIQALEMVSHMRIEPETASIEDVREAIDLSYRSVKIITKMNKEAEEWVKTMLQAQRAAQEKGNRADEESGKAIIQAQTIIQEKANQEAEEAEKARIQAEMMAEKARHEAEEARRQADMIAEKARQKLDEARKQSEIIAREKAKQEALAAQIAQERARREAEEAEKARILAEKIAQEKAKREAEEAEKARILAEKIAQEKAKREAEEAAKARILAEQIAQEKAKREAEEAEKARILAEKIAREKAKREAEEAEKAKREAEEAEKARIRAEKIAREKAKREAEEAEKAKREAEEAEKARILAEKIAREKAKREAEEAEKAKREAEEVEKARIRAEKIAQEKARREAEEAEKAKREAEEAEKAKREAEEAEKARIRAEAIAREKAKREAEEAEKARIQAEAIAREKAKKEALAAQIAQEKARREAEEAEKTRMRTETIAREKAKREAEEAEKARIQAEAIAREKAKHEGREKQHFKWRKDQVQPEALQLIPEALARKYNVVPLDVIGNVLRVVMADVNDIVAIEALETVSRMSIEPETAGIDEVREAIDLSYRSYDEIAKQIATISLPGWEETSIEDIRADSVADAPIAKALTVIIDGAIKSRASDIHIQPEEDNVRVRYRIDGTLHDTIGLPLATAVPLISRLKILAKMNIADRQRPQDGQLSVKPKDRPEIDIRVATIPIVHGEMAALRLLDKSKALMSLPQLGFLPESLAKYQEMLKVPYGMILCTGPTGAGKTTTLYASLNTLDRKGRNIITIEDPVEYRFKNVNQIQVNPKAGLTFANGLRSILRLDPNVLLVGEMRDAETAGIAINASLTGHLVLSTIHANDAIGVVARLLDLGIEPFLVASALIGVVAQRMARRVCRDCSRLVEAPLIEQAAYTKQTGEVRKEFLYGSGCKSCSKTGYQGRIGFYEILRISDVLRTMLLEGANASELKEQALKEGTVPLIRDGMLKVKAGITTPAEVLRNAYSVD